MIVELALALQLRLRPQKVQAAPRVVLVLLDDVAKVDLDQQRAAGFAPNIDYLATHGFEFTECQSNPICQPSRWSIGWGQWHAARTGDVCSGPSGLEPPLALVSLPQHCGVPSAFFGKWDTSAAPVGYWTFSPQAYGWGLWRAGIPHHIADCGGHDYYWWPRVEDGIFDLPLGLYEPGWMLARANAYLDATAGPALVYFSAQLAHEPYHRPPREFLPPGYPGTGTDRAKYLAMIAALDVSVGRLLQHLTSDDIVVIAGDNGTPAEVVPGGSPGKDSTFDRGVHVPLILAGGGIQVGQSDAVCHLADLYNTLGSLLGQAPDTSLPSADLAPIWQGTATQAHDYVFCGVFGDPRFPDDCCARSQLYKLRQVDVDHDGVIDIEQFFVEPDETVDHIADPSFATEVAAHRNWLAANKP